MNTTPLPARPKRPLAVTMLAVVVLLLSATNLIGAYAGLSRWPTFASFSLSIPLGALIALHGLWGLVWLAVAWGLWRAARWSRGAALVAFPLYSLMVIGEQILLVQGAYERGRLPFLVVSIVVVNLIILGVMTRPGIVRAFERRGRIGNAKERVDYDNRSQD
jgi:hypothetical protein